VREKRGREIKKQKEKRNSSERKERKKQKIERNWK